MVFDEELETTVEESCSSNVCICQCYQRQKAQKAMKSVGALSAKKHEFYEKKHME